MADFVDPNGLNTLMDDVRMDIMHIAQANTPMRYRMTVNEIHFNQARILGKLDSVRRLMRDKNEADTFISVSLSALQDASAGAIRRTKRAPRSRAD